MPGDSITSPSNPSIFAGGFTSLAKVLTEQTSTTLSSSNHFAIGKS